MSEAGGGKALARAESTWFPEANRPTFTQYTPCPWRLPARNSPSYLFPFVYTRTPFPAKQRKKKKVKRESRRLNAHNSQHDARFTFFLVV